MGKPANQQLQMLLDKNSNESVVWKNFLRFMNGSKYTKQNYIIWIYNYMRFHNIDNPDGLIQNQDTRKIQLMIIDFIDYLRDKRKASQKTLLSYYSALKRFYDIQDFYGMNFAAINWNVIREHYIGSGIKKSADRAYTREEIIKLLEKANERDRVIVLLLAGSLRTGGIPSLQYKDLTPIDEHNVYKLIVYRGTEDEYFTYTTPELRQAIDSYLQWRVRLGEQLQKDTPLIRANFDKRNPDIINNPKPVTAAAVKAIVFDLIANAGLRYGNKIQRIGDRYEVMGAHGLRKWAISQMISAGVEYNTREKLAGHKTPGLDSSYDRRPEIQHLAEFLKAIPLLTISSEERQRLTIASLEAKQNEERTRLEKILEDREKLTHATVNQFSEELFKMKREIEKLKGQKS